MVFAYLTCVAGRIIASRFPARYVWEESDTGFHNEPLWWQYVYQLVVIYSRMCNLIYVFMQYDACLVMSGVGYRAKTEKTPETFNAFPCVGAAKSWAAQNVFDILANWNMPTQRWLKYYVYLRLLDRNLPRGKPQVKAYLATFAVSCLWHGFYPGFYLVGFGVALQGLVW